MYPNWVTRLENRTPIHCNRDPLDCRYAHPRFPEQRVALHWRSVLAALVFTLSPPAHPYCRNGNLCRNSHTSSDRLAPKFGH